MLFGGTAAVYAFNRAARGIWFAISNLLRVCWTNYYDDYPTVEPKCTSGIAKTAIESCLRLLGWDFADEGDKCLPFSDKFVVLGAQANLVNMAKGRAYIENKPGRVDSIASQVRKSKEAGYLSSGTAAEIKGKFVYAEAQCYGRIATRCIKLLGEVASGKRSGSPLDPVLAEVLDWLIERLSTATPRPIFADRNFDSIIIFTDASSEGNDHSCGAVLLDKHTNSFEYFGFAIRPELIVEWRASGITQIITHAEVYPVWLARSVWGTRLRGRRVITFVDNNAAKDSLVKGSMDSIHGDWMLQAVLQLEFGQQSHGWYARVPSLSNIADGPSRLDFEELRGDKRFKKITPRQPFSFKGGSGMLDPNVVQ